MISTGRSPSLLLSWLMRVSIADDVARGLAFNGYDKDMANSDEHVVVDETSKATADERADLVDPVVGEVARCDGRVEGAGGVHGPPLKGPTARMLVPTPMAMGAMVLEGALLGVGGAGAHGVHEREGDADLEHHALHLADAGSAVGRDGLAMGHDLEEQAHHKCAEQLGHPVEEAGEDGDAATSSQARSQRGLGGRRRCSR